MGSSMGSFEGLTHALTHACVLIILTAFELESCRYGISIQIVRVPHFFDQSMFGSMSAWIAAKTG